MLRLLLLFALFGGLSCSKDQPPMAPAGKKTGDDFADLFDAFDALQEADGDTASDSSASSAPDSIVASVPDSLVFSPTAAVAIPDEALRRYIEKVLKKRRGVTITHADMRKIVNLLEGHTTFQGIDYRLRIKSLVGLEAATNLQNVAMSGQQISDVSPLANLPKLRSLDIRGNQISDVSPLANLVNLRYLDLRGNPFLNDVSINEHVPALQSRGVEVVLSPYERTFPDSPFDIELVFVDDFTEVEKKIVRQAANRWESAIQADIPDYTFSEPKSIGCGITNGKGNFFTIPAGERIDDLRIYVVKFPDEDGAPQGLMSMNMDFMSPSGFPHANCIQFNERISSRFGTLWRIALHEIGHALGIGLLTYESDMLHNLGTADAHFAGPQAIAAFDQAGGTNFQGSKVPTTRDGSHWRFTKELMGRYGRFEYLSAITLGALSDLGYTVDFSAADPFELPPLGAAKPVADAVPFCLVERLPTPVYVDD